MNFIETLFMFVSLLRVCFSVSLSSSLITVLNAVFLAGENRFVKWKKDSDSLALDSTSALRVVS